MSERPLWKVLLAFFIVYFVWGSTFLAIRVGVHQMPPLIMAALRFGIAGALLFGWTRIRGERLPNGHQWLSITLLAAIIFVCDYGLLFWAETRVPSGIAAVMLATIPAFMAVGEVALLRTRRFTPSLALSLLVGLGGVVVLSVQSASMGAAAISPIGAGALVIAAVSWSVASILTRKLPLPESKMVSSGAQMLIGGVLLTVVSGAFGEWPQFHPATIPTGAWLALAYLIAAGSIAGYTAYLWLIHHESPTKVGTYAYVNPVVAVAVGYWLGGEELGIRTLIGTALVLASVLAIMMSRTTSASPGGSSAAANETRR
ncbi:MAG TPA: EamA family transporter [Terracidiphilus sp.]|jgi:drug/metabolite transporter (DMT)-like permease